MTPELTVLALAALLQFIQFCGYSLSATLQVGVKVTAGSRDKPITLTGSTGRQQRAFANHFEALTLFTIAVLVVTLGDQSTGFTAACAWVFLAARLLYVPAYIFGLVPWRSIIWFVGVLATVAMLISALI
ncbi:MAG: MAPEG family protein [Rhodobacteraceae bacterium]|nr:MAPEG family protein [Paracoccaceae bacterium]